MSAHHPATLWIGGSMHTAHMLRQIGADAIHDDEISAERVRGRYCIAAPSGVNRDPDAAAERDARRALQLGASAAAIIPRDALGGAADVADLIESANGAGVDLAALVAMARPVAGHAAAAVPIDWPAPLDLEKLDESEPLPPRHIIPDWLPAGEVTLLAGHGGGGKSQLALYTAACVDLGRAWCGLEADPRPVTYISAEDGADILHWRLTRIAAHLGVTLADLAGLQIIDASGIDAELMREMPYGAEPMLTPLYERLREIVDPSGLLILDGVSDLYGASEIVRRHVRRFIRALRRLINEDGAVLLLAHVDKAAARDGTTTDRYSGSTAWHNSVRARWSLATNGDALVLTLAKANHARAGAEIRWRWDESAHLYVPDPVTAEGGIAGAIKERQERDGIVAAMTACAAAGIVVPAATQGPRTAYHVLRAQPSFPVGLADDSRAARRRFWAQIEQLRVMRTIDERVIRAQHRHPIATLVLSTEGKSA